MIAAATPRSRYRISTFPITGEGGLLRCEHPHVNAHGTEFLETIPCQYLYNLGVDTFSPHFGRTDGETDFGGHILSRILSVAVPNEFVGLFEHNAEPGRGFVHNPVINIGISCDRRIKI